MLRWVGSVTVQVLYVGERGGRGMVNCTDPSHLLHLLYHHRADGASLVLWSLYAGRVWLSALREREPRSAKQVHGSWRIGKGPEWRK